MIFLRGRIIGRLEYGRTQLDVSEELGITQSVISRLWQRFQDDRNVSRCCSTGRPRVTTPNEDRYLAVTAKRNRRSTASETVSRQTVYRLLGNIGLYARRPVRCVPLTATHCRLLLTWIREHALWTPQQWSCVMFSDESRFSLQSDSRRTLIWRAPGTRYHQENTIERLRCRMARLGRNYSWFQNSPACSECNDDRPHLSGCHSGTTCTFVSGRLGC
ncbi:HTH_Tnp_Tc3_2 domain-containing protein [Trichonephila clavipes]|nr:HTH_Tnp_Tc3_2 domain-containing protein [Trichonephila clavipes]